MGEHVNMQVVVQPEKPPVARPAGFVQRKCACGGTPGADGECAQCRAKRLSLQRRSIDGSAATHVPPIVHDVLRSPGQPLDVATRTFMEPRFGHDFSQVRVHTDARAAESARAVDALAYTVGNHVAFGSGHYTPHTAEGQRLLAHEISHVMQQRAAGDTRPSHITIGPVNDRYEQEAGHVAGQIATPGLTRVTNSPVIPAVLQRQPDPRVHASPAGTRSPSVNYEKWGESVESSYRRAGLTAAADAVRRCREEGACDKLLTETEAWNMYRDGRITAGLQAPSRAEAGPAAAGAAPLAAGVLAAPAAGGGTAAATESALARAAVRWGSAAVIEGGEAAGATVATGGAAATATVAVPVAVGVVLVVAVVDLIAWSRFQGVLQRHGYIILPNILGVCIGSCHQPTQPSLPTFREYPRLLPSRPPGQLTRDDYDAIERWIRESGPQGSSQRSQPQPAPQPTVSSQPSPTASAAPVPTIQERRARCEQIWNRYKALGNCRSCNRNDTPVERAAKIACLTAVIAGREEYLSENCDDVLEGSIRRGSAVARRGHEIQVEQLRRALAACRTLPTR